MIPPRENPLPADELDREAVVVNDRRHVSYRGDRKNITQLGIMSSRQSPPIGFWCTEHYNAHDPWEWGTWTHVFTEGPVYDLVYAALMAKTVSGAVPDALVEQIRWELDNG
jgi:hypothetical protein